MGRQNRDPTVINSSIALLQERFRKLQKVKELREERELLRLFSESERISPSPTIRNEPSRPFFHPELIIPPQPPLQASLSLQPKSQGKYANYCPVDTPLLMSLWPTDRSIKRSSNNFDEDVDTSLHL